MVSRSHSHPVHMAPDQTKCVLEAARAAAMAAHNAAGLATSAGLRSSVRLLRTAEALARSAGAALVSSSSTQSAPTGSPSASARAARRRVKRQKEKEKKQAQDMSKGEGHPVEQEVKLGVLPVGSSVVYGDLAELGVAGSTLVVPAATSASSSWRKGSRTTVLATRASTSGEARMAVDGGGEVDPGGDSSAGQGLPKDRRAAKTWFFCSCRFGEPISHKLRCKGCGWQYKTDDLKDLRQRPKTSKAEA